MDTLTLPWVLSCSPWHAAMRRMKASPFISYPTSRSISSSTKQQSRSPVWIMAVTCQLLLRFNFWPIRSGHNTEQKERNVHLWSCVCWKSTIMEEFTGNQKRRRLRGWKTIKQSHKGNECHPKTKHKTWAERQLPSRESSQSDSSWKSPHMPKMLIWVCGGCQGCFPTQSLLSGPAVLNPRLNPRIPKGLGVSWEKAGTQVSLRLQGI